MLVPTLYVVLTYFIWSKVYLLYRELRKRLLIYFNQDFQSNCRLMLPSLCDLNSNLSMTPAPPALVDMSLYCHHKIRKCVGR